MSRQVQADEGPSIEDAEVIVAGGMGLGAAENFSLAEELAALLGGVVGATRAAVYDGLVSAVGPDRPDRARRSRRSCTSPSASRARCSTRSACRARR